MKMPYHLSLTARKFVSFVLSRLWLLANCARTSSAKPLRKVSCIIRRVSKSTYSIQTISSFVRLIVSLTPSPVLVARYHVPQAAISFASANCTWFWRSNV